MIKFDSQYILNSITPLENMFIQQYLVKAPGDYVKVYIYCLNLCHWPMGDVRVSYNSIAETLRLNCEDVQRALRYWCKLGVMRVECFEEQLEMEIYSVRETMARNEASDGQTLYTFRAFNNELSDAFHPRILDTQDYLLYQDMINILPENSNIKAFAENFEIIGNIQDSEQAFENLFGKACKRPPKLKNPT